jgi:hypothetical protein
MVLKIVRFNECQKHNTTYLYTLLVANNFNLMVCFKSFPGTYNVGIVDNKNAL